MVFLALLIIVIVEPMRIAARAQISNSILGIGVMNDMSEGCGHGWSGHSTDGGRRPWRRCARRTDRGVRRRPPEQARRRPILACSWYEQSKVDAIVEVPVSSAATMRPVLSVRCLQESTGRDCEPCPRDVVERRQSRAVSAAAYAAKSEWYRPYDKGRAKLSSCPSGSVTWK
jgi:hypothetical protein